MNPHLFSELMYSHSCTIVSWIETLVRKYCAVVIARAIPCLSSTDPEGREREREREQQISPEKEESQIRIVNCRSGELFCA